MEGFGESYSFGKLEPDDLKRVRQLEEQLNAQRQKKIVLIAYENKTPDEVLG